MNKVILNGVDLSIEDVVNVARNGYQVEIDKDCMAHIAEVRNYMESEWMRDDAPAVYGFNTGLGKHKDHKVTIEESDLHQYRTVLSHCGGVGDPAPEEVVRAAMCVRLNAFCRGVSGLRPVVVERLVELLNKGVHPVVPGRAAWALRRPCPMAHIVSVLIGVPQPRPSIRRAHACTGSAEKGRHYPRRVPAQGQGLPGAAQRHHNVRRYGVPERARRRAPVQALRDHDRAVS